MTGMNLPLPKLALLFPGVGAQETGMARSFYDHLPYIKDIFDEASDLVHLNLKDICFSEDHTAQLNQIDISQVALFTTSMAILQAFKQELDLTPAFSLGHSLGEYSALCASGILRFGDAVEIVYQRGQIIKEITDAEYGTMLWVINLATEIVDTLCASYQAHNHLVFVATYDSPTQCAISGTVEAAAQIVPELEQYGAIVYPLKMAGPYHSPLMQPAADRLQEVLCRYQFNEPTMQTIANYNAQPYQGRNSVTHSLSTQLIAPVRWHESIGYLLDAGVSIAIEVGPKNLLQFLLKKNTAAIDIVSLNDYAMLDEINRTFIRDSPEALSIIERCLRTAVNTRNWNDNLDEYHEKVVQPYQELAQLYHELVAADLTPGTAHINKALAIAQSVLAAKQVPSKIKQRKLVELVDNKILKFSETG